MIGQKKRGRMKDKKLKVAILSPLPFLPLAGEGALHSGPYLRAPSPAKGRKGRGDKIHARKSSSIKQVTLTKAILKNTILLEIKNL